MRPLLSVFLILQVQEQVLLEYGSINHSMNFIGGDEWRWRNWKPATEAVYNYTIYMEDNDGNLNITSGNFTVISTTAPIIENLTFSENPLELGNNITISVDVYDNETYVSAVLIELDNVNYTMTNFTLFNFEFNWTKNTIGPVIFTIYANDTGNNWNQYADSFNIVDTTAPNFLNLIESADPLELGSIEILTINITDIGGINQVLIDIGTGNLSMVNIIGDTWQHNSWLPSSTGNKSYTIWMEDASNNWNSTTGYILVRDTIAPMYSDLFESSDPVELGTTLIITINTTDISGINRVKIEFEGINQSMSNIGGGIWQYNTWMPTATGNYTYTIYIEDNNNNWNSTSDWIIFQDTISPSFSTLIEGAASGGSVDPLELGDTLILTIIINDFGGIYQTLIEYEGSNHSMVNIVGNLWYYNSWTPLSIDNNTYRIFTEDNSGNWNITTDWIMVNDTTNPSEPIFSSAPSGEITGIFTFDWKEGNDPSGIDYYIFIISTQDDINNTAAYVLNINTTNTYYRLTEALPLGTYYYFLAQVDNAGLQSSFTVGTFTVVSPPEEGNFLLIIIIVIAAAAAVSIAAIFIVKRRSQVALLPPKKKIPFKTIFSHINRISSSEQIFEKDKFTQKLAAEKIKKAPLQLESMDKLELEQKLDEIQTFGEELYSEGAYFEALKQYKVTEKILAILGRHEEAFIYSDLITEINKNLEVREKTLNVLKEEVIKGDFMRIFNVYYVLIEISKKLNDYNSIDKYQSELIEIFHEKKNSTAELELKKSIFEENARTFYEQKDYEKATKFYKQCERFSHFLFQLGKQKELSNVKKFRTKRIESSKKDKNNL
jgi:tetratricopeptide (TPR) repeat protein